MNRSSPGLPVHHQLPEFTQTHVHRVSDAIQPSHPLSYTSYLISYVMTWKSTASGEHVHGVKLHLQTFQNKHPQFLQWYTHINTFKKHWGSAVNKEANGDDDGDNGTRTILTSTTLTVRRKKEKKLWLCNERWAMTMATSQTQDHFPHWVRLWPSQNVRRKRKCNIQRHLEIDTTLAYIFSTLSSEFWRSTRRWAGRSGQRAGAPRERNSMSKTW